MIIQCDVFQISHNTYKVHILVSKAFLNWWVFILQATFEQVKRRSPVKWFWRLFHRAGPALLNTWLPHLWCVSDTLRRYLLLDCKTLGTQRGFMISAKLYKTSHIYFWYQWCTRVISYLLHDTLVRGSWIQCGTSLVTSAGSWAHKWCGAPVFVWWLSKPLHSDSTGDHSAGAAADHTEVHYLCQVCKWWERALSARRHQYSGTFGSCQCSTGDTLLTCRWRQYGMPPSSRYRWQAQPQGQGVSHR